MDNLEYQKSGKDVENFKKGKNTPIFEHKQSEMIDTSAAEVQAEIDRKRVADQVAYEEAIRRQELHNQSLNYYKGSTYESTEETQISKGRTR